MAIEEDSPKFWTKLSAGVGCFSLLMFETYVLTSMPHELKYKIYRFQFALVLNMVFVVGSKYLWKRLVKDIIKPTTSKRFSFPWKLSVFFYLFLSHLAPFTIYSLHDDPTLLGMTSWTCFGAYILFFFTLFPLSLAVHILNHVTGKRLLSRRKQSISCVIFVAIFTWFAYHTAASSPDVISVEVPVRNLPKSMNNFQIALICDIHLGPTVGLTLLTRIVKITDRLNTDMVILAGDLTDATVRDMGHVAKPLSHLKPAYGKYFVTDFTILHNSNEKIHSKGSKEDWFCLLGTDDLQADQISYNDHGMNISAAYKGCDNKHAALLIAHQPKAAKKALDAGYDIQLVLSGHTHGGQMYPIVWLCHLFNPYVEGLYKYDSDSYVYVSQGSGYYGFPMRLGSRPEITHITLKSAI